MVSGYDKNPEPIKPGVKGWLIAAAFFAFIGWVMWQLAIRP